MNYTFDPEKEEYTYGWNMTLDYQRLDEDEESVVWEYCQDLENEIDELRTMVIEGREKSLIQKKFKELFGEEL